MFSFFSNWRPKSETSQTLDSLPLPVTAGPKKNRNKKDLHLEPTPISPPIPHSSPQPLTGFDDASGAWGYSQPSPTRVGPSHVAWLNSSRSFDEEKSMPRFETAPPAVVRLEPQPHVHPMGRSISLPPMSSSLSEANDSTRWGLKLRTNEEFSQSTQSLRLDPRPLSYIRDVYGSAYDYPLAKQLSPIAEQDYFSPESLRRTKPLPKASDNDLFAPSIAYSHTNPSPGGSQTSEVAREYRALPLLVIVTSHSLKLSRSFPRLLFSIYYTPTQPNNLANILTHTYIHRLLRPATVRKISRGTHHPST